MKKTNPEPHHDPKQHEPAKPKPSLASELSAEEKNASDILNAIDQIDLEYVDELYAAAIVVHGRPSKRHTSDTAKIEFIRDTAAALKE